MDIQSKVHQMTANRSSNLVRQLTFFLAGLCFFSIARPTSGDEPGGKAVGLRAAQLFQPLTPEPSQGNAGFFVGVNTFTQDTGVRRFPMR